MKPVILLSGDGFRASGANNANPDWTIHKNYAECIRLAGGIPLLAVDETCASEYAELCDGLLLTGGLDVAPALYQSRTLFDNVITDPTRDSMELRLLEAFVNADKPIFGICRGIQIINTYFGGSLYQDIPAELGSNCHSDGRAHPLTIAPDSFLSQLFGCETIVNSYHHQAVKDAGTGLIPLAWSDANGSPLIEAVSHQNKPIWAVQWHPERMMLSPSISVTTPEECEDSLPLFCFFIEQCK